MALIAVERREPVGRRAATVFGAKVATSAGASAP